MREIKFRAENKKTGILHNLVGFMTEYDEGDNILLYVCRSTIEATGEIVEFVADTLQQYTGLEDKNGKEICEGDIGKKMYGTREIIGVVKYLSCGFWFEGTEIENNGLHHASIGKDWKIIGNIYENSELLK